MAASTLKVKSPTTAAPAEKAQVVKQPKPKANNSPAGYGTGRRKNAIARVWVKAGNGQMIVNKKPIELYFAREAHIKTISQVLVATKVLGQYDIMCTVKGGGCSGQAGAVVHGLARALDQLVPDLHKTLRQGGFLTRDSRVVERKKYGKHKARKSTQFSKR